MDRGAYRAFEYFGGVSALLIPDNLKSGVTKACRYEPDLNPTYLEMCQYYGTVAMPARAGKPKDKAKVEAGVLLVTRWITAALRHRTFFSIAELNTAIRELLERLNTRKFKKLDTTRWQLFEAIDKTGTEAPCLHRDTNMPNGKGPRSISIITLK